MTNMFDAYINSRTNANTMVDVVIFIVLVVSYWRLFEKAGQPGWVAVIPLYDIYKLFEISMGSGLIALLLLIPGINIIVLIMLGINTARAFGQSMGFAAGLILLPPVFYAILGFSNAQYYGPKGIEFFGNYRRRRTDSTGFGAYENTTGTYDSSRHYQRKTYSGYTENNEYDNSNAQTVDFDVKPNDK